MITPKQLSQEAIERFKAIYQREFGQNLSDDEAQEIALPVLNLFRILLYPDIGDVSGRQP